MGVTHALEVARAVPIFTLMGGDWHDGYLKGEVLQALVTMKISDDAMPEGSQLLKLIWMLMKIIMRPLWIRGKVLTRK